MVAVSVKRQNSAIQPIHIRAQSAQMWLGAFALTVPLGRLEVIKQLEAVLEAGPKTFYNILLGVEAVEFGAKFRQPEIQCGDFALTELCPELTILQGRDLFQTIGNVMLNFQTTRVIRHVILHASG